MGIAERLNYTTTISAGTISAGFPNPDTYISYLMRYETEIDDFCDLNGD